MEADARTHAAKRVPGAQAALPAAAARSGWASAWSPAQGLLLAPPAAGRGKWPPQRPCARDGAVARPGATASPQARPSPPLPSRSVWPEPGPKAAARSELLHPGSTGASPATSGDGMRAAGARLGAAPCPLRACGRPPTATRPAGKAAPGPEDARATRVEAGDRKPRPGPRAARPGPQAPSRRDARPRRRHRISDPRVPGTRRLCSRHAGEELTCRVPREPPAPGSLPWRRPRHPRPPAHRVPSPRRRPGLQAPVSLGAPGAGRPHGADGAAAAGPGASRVSTRP